jgi:hypothetical protein
MTSFKLHVEELPQTESATELLNQTAGQTARPVMASGNALSIPYWPAVHSERTSILPTTPTFACTGWLYQSEDLFSCFCASILSKNAFR